MPIRSYAIAGTAASGSMRTNHHIGREKT